MWAVADSGRFGTTRSSRDLGHLFHAGASSPHCMPTLCVEVRALASRHEYSRANSCAPRLSRISCRLASSALPAPSTPLTLTRSVEPQWRRLVEDVVCFLLRGDPWLCIIRWCVHRVNCCFFNHFSAFTSGTQYRQAQHRLWHRTAGATGVADAWSYPRRDTGPSEPGEIPLR
jgi:hypothetical protein